MKKKCFLTYDEQISFLVREKGLHISDRNQAKALLLKTGYFSLINGYKEVFKQSETGKFRNGIDFENIYELYCFDDDLRSLFLKYILMIERTVKSSLAYHFCETYGDLGVDYLNVNHYDYFGKKKPVIDKLMQVLSGQLRMDSDYAYIRHYMTAYHYVPLWVLMNVLTLGQLSKMYASQKGRIQIKICQDFGALRVNELGKMLAVMTKFRNVCAHSDRLFDFRTKDALLDCNLFASLSIPKEKGRYIYGKNDLFAQVMILKSLLSEADFHSYFQCLQECFEKHPIHKAVLDKMGFPSNWEQIDEVQK